MITETTIQTTSRWTKSMGKRNSSNEIHLHMDFEFFLFVLFLKKIVKFQTTKVE